ncbi:ATPase [Carboxydothermus pertinax]|uniref:ATPase n=1 Tax=Carboxydothermus pertinax TaxID=870242 RepID=A0A1L8CUC7_9THEO|nr:ATPase [Carboxydothermus pertinax]GAV22516.1 ATPase [Carboxydothermus pertinax]
MMEKLTKLETAINLLEQHYLLRQGQKAQLEMELQEKEQKLQELAKEREKLEKTRYLLLIAGQYAREQAKKYLEDIATSTLQYVFGPEISLEIELAEKAGSNTAEFYVVSDYGSLKVKNRPEDARGGGVVDILSLALRIFLLSAVEPKIEGPLLLDEPGKHVSEEFIGSLALFLKETSRHFGRQVIMVTHNQHLAGIADKAFLVELKEGTSEIKELTI